MLYHGIANQPSHAYFSLYWSLCFLAFRTLNFENFRQRFRETVQARVTIFDKQVDNNVFYRGIANRSSPAYSSLYLYGFLSFFLLFILCICTCYTKQFT